MNALSNSETEGLRGSFENTRILFDTEPALPAVSSFAAICPFSPGLSRPELAMAAVHPQEGIISSIMRS